jgi:lysophospholipase L1-like esterase
MKIPKPEEIVNMAHHLTAALMLFAAIGLHADDLAKAERVSIMPFGDSITKGQSSPTDVPGGYRARLHSLLMAKGVAVDFVGTQADNPSPELPPSSRHEGYPGCRIDELAPYAAAKIREFTPDIVLLHLGTNDIAQHHALDSAATRIDAMIGTMLAACPKTTVIVATIIRMDAAGSQPLADAYNEQLRAQVEARRKRGERVVLVEMATALTPAMMSDPWHPNKQGYDKMAELWAKAVMEQL